MTEETMSKFRCWSKEAVGRTVFSDIGALAADADAIFLAAHTPVRLVHQKGPELSAPGSGEAQVLAALTSQIGDVERNTLVAVTGASGSGKSHVVRWVHSHLPTDAPNHHVLYVPRAIQTLRELLRRIIDGLPGVDGSELMGRVDQAISNVKPGEFQARLVNELKIALDWTLEDRAPIDGETAAEAEAREDRNSMLGERDPESGGRRDGLGALLELPQFRNALLRPEGRLAQLVRSYFDEESRRSDDEVFTREDLPLRERGIRGALARSRDLADLWTVITRHPEDVLVLLEDALRIALPKTVGLRSAGGETLDSLFRASRKALRASGRDLVLVFEDLAQFGLVDRELYDQFVTPPGEDLAPLRVLFAITDGPYQRLERTVRTRVQHEFHVDASALGDRERFVGRYLNLVRVGRERTQALWSPGADEQPGHSWMENACDTLDQGQPCRFRDVCHPAFGSVPIDGLGDVGLYPYNHVALQRAITALGHDPTPRDVLDRCVSTVLTEADVHIESGDYPHERTNQLFDFRVERAPDSVREENPSSDPDRMYRAVVIWGNESRLPEGVLTAFSLDGAAVLTTPPPTSPPTSPPTPPPPNLPNTLQPLYQWRNGEQLPDDDVNYYRDTLRRFTLDRLHLDQRLAHIHAGRGKEILERIFSITSFDIEGSRGRPAGPQTVRFDITRTPENVRVMAAARWFREHGHFEQNHPENKFQWPEGNRPADLAIALETRLDNWAEEVRARFLEVTGGTRLAQQAVGVRAVAMAAAGCRRDEFATVSSLLRPSSDQPPRASKSWSDVDAVASEIVATLKAAEYVAEFAAVRQGETGAPQLVDPRPLNAAIEAFLADPHGELEAVGASEADPALAQTAQRLLSALTPVAHQEVEEASRAHAVVRGLLEGHPPRRVSEWAYDVGDAAREAGVFRPAEGWRAFVAEVEALAGSADLEPDAGGVTLGAVLLNQRQARELYRLERSLSFIKGAMEATKNECERATGAGGDLSKARGKVRAQLEELRQLIESLGERSMP